MSSSRGRVAGDLDREVDPIAPTALLGEDADGFERVVTGQSPGPLAVCGPPFGGRDRVLGHAADRLGVDPLRLGPDDDVEVVLSALGDDHPVTVVVNDRAYYRRIKAKAYVADLRDEFAFSSDVTERSLAAFEQEGIETPEAPPASLSAESR